MLVNNHTHICHIMLCHFEKEWNAAQSFRDLELLAKEQSAKVEWFARFKSGEKRKFSISLEDKAVIIRPMD